MSFAENQTFLLGQEKQESRPFELYAEDGSVEIEPDGTILAESNSQAVLPGNNYLVSKVSSEIYTVAEVGSGWIIVSPSVVVNTEFENYTRIVQPNLTNPRIRELSAKKSAPFLNLIEGLEVWEVRVVLDNGGSLLNFLKVNRTYIVKTNRGLRKFRAVQTQDSYIQGLFTTLIMEPLEWLIVAS